MSLNGGFVQIAAKKIYNWAKTEEWRYTLGLFAMGSSCSNHLGIPPPKGPNHVGCTDFMMDHTAQGSFFRLYYPCQKTEKAEKPDWVPNMEYFYGLADFMKINRTWSEKIFEYLFGSYKIPAFMDAPFQSSEKCPVVIFSHGLGAFRTLYSAICVELASHGFMVASVEHSIETRGPYGGEHNGLGCSVRESVPAAAGSKAGAAELTRGPSSADPLCHKPAAWRDSGASPDSRLGLRQQTLRRA